MLKTRSFYLVLLPLLFSNTAYSEAFFGLWENPQGSSSYSFEPLGGNNIGMIVVTNGYMDVYVGSYEGSNFSVCTNADEPFNACYSGAINSESSIRLFLDSCENKTLDICSLLSDVDLSREIVHDINGIFYVALTEDYFMINEGGGLISAARLYVGLEEALIFEGTRSGNTGAVQAPLDPNAPEFELEVLSRSEIKLVVTNCDSCPTDGDITPQDVGLSFNITRVTR